MPTLLELQNQIYELDTRVASTPVASAVTSVNGQVGVVVITAASIGAAESGGNVSQFTNDAGYITTAVQSIVAGDGTSVDNTDPSNPIISADGGSTDMMLAPDLDLPSRILSTKAYEEVNFDPSGSLTEALGLSGKFAIYALTLTGLPTSEALTIKMTVDGVVIHNNSVLSLTSSQLALYGQALPSTSLMTMSPFICNSAFSLEIETAVDSSVTLNYIVRPIL